MAPKTVFAHHVRAARWREQMSQAELASRSYLSLDEILAVEDGRFVPRLWQVLLLADVLDLGRDALCRHALAALYKEEEPDAHPCQRAAAAAAGA
jgi:DNA-binding XRE family transcriptional regulator